MTNPALLAIAKRGPFEESRHFGHIVIANASGDVVQSWGDPEKVILPRSSAKMLQALPLLESGAGSNLTSEQLALSCASHSGETRHVTRVRAWLADLGLSEENLCCGPQASRDRQLRHDMLVNGQAPTRAHNNCSGKHAGFLTLSQHLRGSSDYVDPNHPVQQAIRNAFEEMCEEPSPGFGIDGCSAPNFACTMTGFARALANFASYRRRSDARGSACARLVSAMIAHPELVSGKGRACAQLTYASGHRAAVKTGAEGVFAAIIPDLEIGVAIKVEDGATRASEAAMAAILVHLGVVEPNDPRVQKYMHGPILNWDGMNVGSLIAAPGIISA